MKKWGMILLILLMLPLEAKAISTSATSAVLMDQDSGRMLYQQRVHTVRSVASISKIMTGIIACESGKLKKMVTINDVVKRAYGSGIYVKEGERLTLEDLVYGLMLRSGNDAALAIADFVSGSVDKFVEKMNQKAKEIGMYHTTFYNPSGLDEEKEVGNYSTAYDMAILMRYAMQNPNFRTIVGTKKYTVKTNQNHYVWHNKNKLLNTYPHTTGGKTGFTKKARRTLVSTATKDHKNLIVVTLNDGDDFQDHKNLHEYGFQNYEPYLILKKGTILKDEPFYKGDQLYIETDIKMLLKEQEKDLVHLNYRLDKKNGYHHQDQVGVVEVKFGDNLVSTYPIKVSVKKEIKQRKNFFEKVKGWFFR